MGKATCNRGVCNWTKCDSILAVFAVLAIVTSVICAFMILPRWEAVPKWHGGRDEEGRPKAPEYYETQCQVVKVMKTEDVTCSRNSYGEWSDAIGMENRYPNDDDDYDEDGDDKYDDDQHDRGRKRRTARGREEGRQGGTERNPMFPCVIVKVRYTPNTQHGREDRIGTLYKDWKQAENFPTCTESSCQDWYMDNEREMRDIEQDWKTNYEMKEKFECYYNANHMDEVVKEKPGYSWLSKKESFQFVFWPAFLAVIFIAIIVIRRICFSCKHVYHEEHKVDFSKNDLASPYMVDPSIPNKEEYPDEKKYPLPDSSFYQPEMNMAKVDGCNYEPFKDGPPPFITGPPPTYEDGRLPDSVMGSTLSLPSSPPAYEIIIRPSHLDGKK